MLFSEILAVNCNHYAKHINTLWETIECNSHCASEGYNTVVSSRISAFLTLKINVHFYIRVYLRVLGVFHNKQLLFH
jgi:cytidylate kinase